MFCPLFAIKQKNKHKDINIWKHFAKFYITSVNQTQGSFDYKGLNGNRTDLSG